MNGMTPIVETWVRWAVASSWQIALLAVVIAAVALATRRLSARFRYLLWSLILIKVFLPPSLAVVWGVGHWGIEPAWEETRTAVPFVANPVGMDPVAVGSPMPSESASRTVGEGSASVQPLAAGEQGAFSQTGVSGPSDRSDKSDKSETSDKSDSISLSGSVRPVSDWRLIAFAVWIVGVLAFAGLVVWRYVRLLVRLRRAESVDEGPLRIELDRLALAMEKSNPPELLLSKDITSPFLIGLLRPRIVLPDGLVVSLSPEHLRNVLLHELTHWKRGDVWVGWAQVLAQALFWFHPVVWLANAQIRHERESACDEEAIGRGNCDPVQYGESLLKVLLESRGRSATQLGFLGIFERGTKIQKRLEDIMQRESRRTGFGWGNWVFLAAFALVFFPMAGVRTTQADTQGDMEARLKSTIAVSVDKSPNGDRLSVQYAVIGICEAAKIPYQWERSAKEADPERRRYIEPLHLGNVTAEKALKELLAPAGLAYRVDEKGLYLVRSHEVQPLAAGEKSAAGTTDLVGSSGGGGGSNVSALQAQIDAAAPNATLTIPAGGYAGPLKIDKPISLVGSGATDCVIECFADEPAIRIQGADGVTLKNVTVRWGLKSTEVKERELAAVVIRDSKVVLDGCALEPKDRPRNTSCGLMALGRTDVVFTQGRTTGFEYTFLFTEGANGTITHSVLRDSGHCAVQGHQGTTIKVEGCILSGCEYHGVRSTGGTMEVRNNIIRNNNHAGAYLGNSSAHGVIENNLFVGNRGGIWSFAASDVAIRNNVFIDSKSEAIGFHASCSLTIERNSFVNNPIALVQYSPEKSPGRNGATTKGNHFWTNGTDAKDFEKEPDALEGEPKFADPANFDYTPIDPSPLRLADGGRAAGLLDSEAIALIWRRGKEALEAPAPASGGAAARADSVDVTNTSIVCFAPKRPFAPDTAKELLDAFNEKHPQNVGTHHYRSQVKGDHLVGFICVDGEEGREKVKSMLEASEKLVLLEVEAATAESLERLNQLSQESMPSR